MTTLTDLAREDQQECPVCGAHKGSYQVYCSECEEYEKTAEAIRRRKARERKFGKILDGEF